MKRAATLLVREPAEAECGEFTGHFHWTDPRGRTHTVEPAQLTGPESHPSQWGWNYTNGI